jgi:hypothetical protein
MGGAMKEIHVGVEWCGVSLVGDTENQKSGLEDRLRVENKLENQNGKARSCMPKAGASGKKVTSKH